jgi:hypothetical protein
MTKTCTQVGMYANKTVCMIVAANMMTLRDVCISSYPVLIAIMDQMTATEVSVFLYSLGLVNEVSDGIKMKYMNVRRDLGHVEDWVDELLRRGDPVVLAGRDLNQMEWMYKKPETYWIHNRVIPRFTLWCLGMSKVGYECRKRNNNSNGGPEWHVAQGVHTYGITKEGTLRKKPWGMTKHESRSCSGTGRSCEGLLDSTHMFLPGPGLWKDCYWDLVGERGAEHHSMKVNNITLYFGSEFMSDNLVIDSYFGKSMPDVTSEFGDNSVIKYMNMRTNTVRYAIENDYLEPEFIHYLDEDKYHVSKGVLEDGEMSASVQYYARDSSSDDTWFEILFD